MARLRYAERKKLAVEWKNYCRVTNNYKPTIPQFVAWLQDVKGLRLEPAQQSLKVTLAAPKPEPQPTSKPAVDPASTGTPADPWIDRRVMAK